MLSRLGHSKLLPFKVVIRTLKCLHSFIFALLMPKAFYSNRNHLVFSPSDDLTPVWVLVIKSCMQTGNNCHDKKTVKINRFFLSKGLQVKLANAELEEPFDLAFVYKNQQVPQSSLEFYHHCIVYEQHLATLVILNGVPITFIAKSGRNGILVLDSYSHGQHGCLVGKCTENEFEAFFSQYQISLSPNTNMCSITFV